MRRIKSMDYFKKSVWKDAPFVTYALLSIIIAWYLATLLIFKTTETTHALVRMGAKFNLFIVERGEWWRLITAGFLHIGFRHLLMNGISIYFIGRHLEQIIGHWNFFLVYMTSLIGGNLFSFAFSTNVSAGASTAIFGTFAAYIILAYLNPGNLYLERYARTFGTLLIFNIIFGLTSVGVDNWGHIGGAVYGGLIMALIDFIHLKNNKLIWTIIGIIVIITLTLFVLGIRLTHLGG
ncbi:rhomboid family intramembrane serine protease [Dolosicoccus paucivorans]|uniref:Rhomboid family intramembrane serine protease n=2 Tax=Dolosicoccus paucivorans TaxID=84521 RepID=A0A2N6SLM8_9LACT|nr:rhomboid family intramembrane serine protease [Dolosicoccus paucivorans]